MAPVKLILFDLDDTLVFPHTQSPVCTCTPSKKRSFYKNFHIRIIIV